MTIQSIDFNEMADIRSENAAETMDKLRTEARQGSLEAMTSLGRIYQTGILGMFDHHSAKKYLTKAATNEYSLAQYYLGLLYLEGVLERTETTAYYWFSKAAIQNHPLALLSCGIMHEQGIGTKMDKELAHSYYSRAYHSGCYEAKFRLRPFMAHRSALLAQVLFSCHDLPVEIWQRILYLAQEIPLFSQKEILNLGRPGYDLNLYNTPFDVALDVVCNCPKNCKHVLHFLDAIMSFNEQPAFFSSD